jgi:DNA adenine methylase
MDPVKPFLKWVGGKTQIIKEVIGLFPTEMNNYYEPFVGGGSVLLALLSEVRRGAIQLAGNVFVSDLNLNLISLYVNVQTRPEDLIVAVRRFVTEFATCTGTVVHRKPRTLAEAKTSAESYYYWTRARFNALAAYERDTVEASAMFLFLNKTCFRGVYREGPRGFNVPFGHYTNPTIIDEAHIRVVSDLIQGVVFTCEPFTDALSTIGLGDFIYMDPPYAPVNATSFVDYNAGGFCLEKHQRLFELCRGSAAKGATFLLSNADVPLVKDAFPATGFETKIISCRRAIQSNDPSARANEVLVRQRT